MQRPIPPKQKEEYWSSDDEQEAKPLLNEDKAWLDHDNNQPLPPPAPEEPGMVETPPEPPRLPDILDQLIILIHDLEVAQSSVPHEQQYTSISRRLRIYTTVFTVFALSAVVVPTLLITLLKDLAYQHWDDYFAEQTTKIDLQKAIIANFEKQIVEKQQSYVNLFTPLFNLLSSFYESWRKSEHNCDGYSHYYDDIPLLDYATKFNPEFFCNIEDSAPDGCLDIAKGGCHALYKYSDDYEVYRKIFDSFNDWRATIGYKRDQKNKLIRLESDLANSTWLTRLNPAVVAPVAVVTGLFIIGGIIAAIKYRSTRVNHRKTQDAFYEVRNCAPYMLTPEMKTSMARLGIAVIPEMHIDELLEQVKATAAFYQQRRSRRLAFLSIFSERNHAATGLGLFIQHKIGKILLRNILEEVHLLQPKPRPVTTPAPMAEEPEPSPVPAPDMMVAVKKYKRPHRSDNMVHADDVDLQPLITAVRNKDHAFFMTWVERGYLLSWADHYTHKTLLEHLGEDGDMAGIEFVMQFYSRIAHVPMLKDAVKGAAAANQSIDFIFSLPHADLYYGQALEGARTGGNDVLRAQILARMGNVDVAAYIHDMARGAAITGDEVAISDYIASEEDYPDIHISILEGAATGGHDHIVEKYLRTYTRADDIRPYQVALNAAAAAGDAALVTRILFIYDECLGDRVTECLLVTEALETAAANGHVCLVQDMIARVKLLGLPHNGEASVLNTALLACLESQRYVVAKFLIQAGAELMYAISEENTKDWSDAAFIRMFRELGEPALCYQFASHYDLNTSSYDARKLLPLLLTAYKVHDSNDIDLEAYFGNKEHVRVTQPFNRLHNEIKNIILHTLISYLQSNCKVHEERASDLHDVISMMTSIESIYLLLQEELALLQGNSKKIPDVKSDSIFVRLAATPHSTGHGLFPQSSFLAYLEKCIEVFEGYRLLDEQVGAMLDNEAKYTPRRMLG